MRMAPSFPALETRSGLTERRRQADVAGVGAEVRKDVGLVERDLGQAIVERVEPLHVTSLECPRHTVEVELLLAEELAELHDVVPIAGRYRQSEEAVVELRVDPLQPVEEIDHPGRGRRV